jgi:hypothetical protein
MKKLLGLSSSKICLISGLSLFVTLASFWHLRQNQGHLDRMNSLSQGVNTCFSRISQTFTALMIKDIRSPYLNRSFMAVSDECLGETSKAVSPFKKDLGKGYQLLNQLISEVNWFHEIVVKIHAPLVAKQAVHPPMTPLMDRFSKMENFKTDLIDEMELTVGKLRELQRNDEYLIALSLIIFVLGLSLLSLQDHQRARVIKQLEDSAVNLLQSGRNNTGAVVDQLIDNALSSQNLLITSQVFRDYHGHLLESLAMRQKSVIKNNNQKIFVEEEPITEVRETEFKTSLKEVLISIQNNQPKDLIQATEVRDVHLDVSYEVLEQVMSSSINQLASRRTGGKKILVSNQIHSDKSIINIFLGDSIYTATELSFSQSQLDKNAETIDMNLIILKEMVNESGIQWQLENKVDRNGKIIGANIKLNVKRVPKEKSKLVSLTKGKKRDLAKDLMN